MLTRWPRGERPVDHRPRPPARRRSAPAPNLGTWALAGNTGAAGRRAHPRREPVGAVRPAGVAGVPRAARRGLGGRTSSARRATSGTPSRTRRSTGSRIHRYPLRAATGGPLGYLREYGSALWHTLPAGPQGRRRSTWCTRATRPTCSSCVARRLKRRGARFVFDQHDLVPELYLSRFGRGEDLLYRAVCRLERLTYRAADVVIATNESYREVALTPGRQAAGRRVRGAQRARDRTVPPGAAGRVAQARQAASAVLPRRDGPAGRRRLRAAGAGQAARRARAHRLARGVRRRRRHLRRDGRAVAASSGWPTWSSSPGASRTRTCCATCPPPTCASRPTRSTRSTTSPP